MPCKKLTLNNSIHRATLLAVTAVNALGHVNIVSGRATAPIFTLFSFDGDGLGGTNGLAELAGDTTLLTGRIAT